MWSDVTYFISAWTLNLNSSNLSDEFRHCRHTRVHRRVIFVNVYTMSYTCRRAPH